MRRYKALDRLQEDAYPERQQEHAVEEAAEELAALPPKGEGLGRRAVLRDLRRRPWLETYASVRRGTWGIHQQGGQGYGEADEVVELCVLAGGNLELGR